MTIEKKISSPETKEINKSEIQIYNPKIEVQNILVGNKTERKEKLEIFKENLKKQYIDISKILNDFEEITLNNPDITYKNCLNSIIFSENIQPEIVKIIINGFKKYFKDRKESIKKYNKYKNNTPLLIKELYNSDYKPKGKIDISVYGGCLVVNFKNKKDYLNIKKSKSLGTYRNYFRLISINGNNRDTLKHEYQHYINSKIIKNEFPSIEKLNNLDITDMYKTLKKYDLLKQKYFNKKLLIDILDELIARKNDESSEFSAIIDVLRNNSEYLDINEDKKNRIKK